MEHIEQALACNRAAYDAIRARLRPGVTELELLAAVEDAFARQAGQPLPYRYDLLSGRRAAAISGPATEKAVEAGECLIADLLPQYQGTWCDTTRTFFVGEPGQELRRAYAAVLQALRRGEACLRPGVTGEEVYREVDQCLRDLGYPGLVHHAGHAVGPAPLVQPDFVAGCQIPLEEGMVVTLEPGVYLEGNGIRVENNYLVTAQGARELLHYPEEIEHFVVEGPGR